MTRPAWIKMREQGYGRVIVTSSSAGLFGNFGQASYGAAKMGLVGLIKVLAQEGRKYSITANAIAPMARTRMTEGLTGELGESRDPEQVSSVVSFLAHESCTLSGEILSCGGGRVARIFMGMTRGSWPNCSTRRRSRTTWTRSSTIAATSCRARAVKRASCSPRCSPLDGARVDEPSALGNPGGRLGRRRRPALPVVDRIRRRRCARTVLRRDAAPGAPTRACPRRTRRSAQRPSSHLGDRFRRVHRDVLRRGQDRRHGRAAQLPATAIGDRARVESV